MAERGETSWMRRKAVETSLWMGDRGKNVASVLVPAAFIFPAFVGLGAATLAVGGVMFDEAFNGVLDKGKTVEKQKLAKYGYKDDSLINKLRLAWNPQALFRPFSSR